MDDLGDAPTDQDTEDSLVMSLCTHANFPVIYCIFLVVYSLYVKHELVADTAALNRLCEEIHAELEAMRRGIRITSSQPQRNDWQSRIERREESWEGVRHKLFEGMVNKEGYPQINVSINHMNCIL